MQFPAISFELMTQIKCCVAGICERIHQRGGVYRVFLFIDARYQSCRIELDLAHPIGSTMSVGRRDHVSVGGFNVAKRQQ